MEVDSQLMFHLKLYQAHIWLKQKLDTFASPEVSFFDCVSLTYKKKSCSPNPGLTSALGELENSNNERLYIES